MMILPVTYKVVSCDMNTLFKYYKKDTIRGYCKTCPNYNKIWSCPQYDFEEESYLREYNYAYIIGAKLYLKDIEKELERMNFKSNTEILTFAYNSIRNIVDKKSLSIEKNINNSRILMGGKCLICKTCQRTKSKPCLHPESLRYSLESLGFEVSSITKEILKEDLLFSKDQLPKYCLSISSLLTNDKISKEEIFKFLV
ncbi:DUF2284 domain-containing protein [Haloimpatiens sp. FM7315]|uniref:DUF2284 domain-containing protein n=1 Tax=Haloimpatiens sp. FM7315 TaxID=3298609 RepID=UPI0035A3AE7E